MTDVTQRPSSAARPTRASTMEIYYLRQFFAHFARKLVPEPEWNAPGCRYVGLDPRVYIAAGVRAPWRGALPEAAVPSQADIDRAAIGVALRRMGDAIWKLWHYAERLRAVTTTHVVDQEVA